VRDNRRLIWTTEEDKIEETGELVGAEEILLKIKKTWLGLIV